MKINLTVRKTLTLKLNRADQNALYSLLMNYKKLTKMLPSESMSEKDDQLVAGLLNVLVVDVPKATGYSSWLI